MQDDLAGYLDALEQGECYRVDDVLKESSHELTERVFLIGADGSERGPYIRKQIKAGSGLGQAYERIWQAQQAGKRFLHLPRIIEFSSTGDNRTVIMEYVVGDTLDVAIRAHTHFGSFAFDAIEALCDAVSELHEGFEPPLIHRDLKPANIIMSTGNLTLIDFGIARTFNGESQQDTVSFGTRGYAPPEQFGFGQTDERSDIYAIGMLLAFCLLGEEPSRVLVESGFDDERIPSFLRPVLVRATAFDPAARFASASELKAALSSAYEATRVANAQPSDGYSDDGVTPSYVPDDGRPVPPASGKAHMPPPPKDVGPAFVTSPQANSQCSNDAKRPSRLSRVPRKAGAIWDLLICVLWLGIAAFSIYRTFVPFDTMDTYPIAIRAIGYFGIFMIPSAFLLFLALDKRPLRDASPFFARIKPRTVRIVCLSVGLGFLIVSMIVTFGYMSLVG